MAELERLLSELTCGEDARAEACVTSLARLGTAAIVPLLELLASPNPERRWWATRALAELDRPEASQALALALGDVDPSVRQCAALGLRRRPHPAATPALVHALGDPDRLLSRLAADALAALGSAAVPALAEAARSTDPRARVEAVRALAAARQPEAIPALFAALDDPSGLVAHYAEEGLESLGMGMVFFKP